MTTSRLAYLDQCYRRRFRVCLPVAMGALALGMVILPEEVVIAPRQRLVGQEGPLRIVPEVDITTEEFDEKSTTAAPAAAAPTDFVVVDLDYASDPDQEPVPLPNVAPERFSKNLEEFSIKDDVQYAIRTTRHPVLAQTDYVLILSKPPAYPRKAVREGIEGEVTIIMLVNVRGRVDQVFVVNPENYPLLARAATEAVYRWLFKPHLIDGVPTPFWIRVPFAFELIN